MKLIIDISEDVYDHACSRSEDSSDAHTAMRAIANGTPLGVYCDTCEIGNPCLYCKHEFESQESEDKDAT